MALRERYQNGRESIHNFQILVGWSGEFSGAVKIQKADLGIFSDI